MITQAIRAASMLLLSFAFLSCAESDPEPCETTETASGYGWLFIQSGTETTMEGTADDGYSLTMKGVSRIMGFTERPSHVVENLTVMDFKGIWEQTGENSFQADPPNAALSFVLGEEQVLPDSDPVVSMIVTLSEPTFTEEEGGTYSVTYKLTNVDTTGVPEGFLATLPLTLNDAELVIDSFWGSVGCTFCKAGMAAMTSAMELAMDAGGEGEVEAAAVVTAGLAAKAAGVAFVKSTAVQSACKGLADVLAPLAPGISNSDAEQCLSQLCIANTVVIISSGGQAFAPLAGWALGQVACGCKTIAEACN